jgi:hypothetical protein
VNAFTFAWTGSHSFCFPPPRLVFRTLQHARECRSRIVLVVLDWKSQPWWPLLVSCQSPEWAPSVGRFRRLSGASRTLRPGRTPEAAFFGRGYPECDLFVLEFDFSDVSHGSLISCADVFLHGDWSLEASGLSMNDSEIASLNAELRARAAQARAPATLSTYSGPWQKFKSWCLEKGVPYLPASPLTVALYLTKAMRSASSPSPVLGPFSCTITWRGFLPRQVTPWSRCLGRTHIALRSLARIRRRLCLPPISVVCLTSGVTPRRLLCST